jgi:hypothetical protein
VASKIRGVTSRSGGVIDINGAWVTEQKRSKKGRLGKKGKTRIEITADPMIVDPDAQGAAVLYASAVAEVVRDQLLKVRETAAPETLERRRRHDRNRNTKSYRVRYRGGRTGETAPDPNSVKWGIDSGRLRGGVTVRVRRRSTGLATATLNVPANRLEPISFGLAHWERFRDDMRRLVPALEGKFDADPAGAAKIRKVLASIADSVVTTKDAAYRRLIIRRRKILFQLLQQATGVNVSGAASVLGLLE